jgi:tRNA pseudouridine55 synthase
VNGALLVDKPAGITSHDVVAIVRRALSEEGRSSRPAVGHTGTLDPFATGLLVVLVGKATRLARFLDGFEKSYWTVVRLGQGSDTDDATGTLGPAADGPQPTTDAVKKAVVSFVGTHSQMPPAFSAKKIDGQRAYARARKGEEVVLKPVEVTIHAADLIRYEWPDVEIRVRVSTGTYIRSVARDLGTKLGIPAHCAELRRERIGRFSVAGAEALEALQGAEAQGRRGAATLIPMAEVVSHLPRQTLGPAEVAYVKNGRKVATEITEGPIALVEGNELLAIAEVVEGMAQPVVVLAE